MVHMDYDLPVRFRACSPPRLAATQLARSAVLNRLIAPTGLSPALTPASRAHQELLTDPYFPSHEAGASARDVKISISTARLSGGLGLGEEALHTPGAFPPGLARHLDAAGDIDGIGAHGPHGGAHVFRLQAAGENNV